MAIPTHLHFWARLSFLAAFAWGCLASAQEPQTPPPSPSEVNSQTQPSAPLPCVQPAPIPTWKDYDGKFSKLVGTFTRKLERKSVHPPHYKPGAVLCTLEAKNKFLLFRSGHL